MSDLYTEVYDRIEQFRESGFEPDKVVVHSNEWEAFKNKAEVKQDSDTFGGEATYVNGIRVFHNTPQPNARIMFEVKTDD